MSSIFLSRLRFSVTLWYPFLDALGGFRMNFSLAIVFIVRIFDGADRLEILYWMGLSKGIFSGSSTNIGMESAIPTAQRSLTNLISSGGLDSSRISPSLEVIMSVPVALGTIAHMGISGQLPLGDD